MLIVRTAAVAAGAPRAGTASVRSLAEAKKFYETLGLEVMPEEVVEGEKVRVVAPLHPEDFAS